MKTSLSFACGAALPHSAIQRYPAIVQRTKSAREIGRSCLEFKRRACSSKDTIAGRLVLGTGTTIDLRKSVAIFISTAISSTLKFHCLSAFATESAAISRRILSLEKFLSVEIRGEICSYLRTRVPEKIIARLAYDNTIR